MLSCILNNAQAKGMTSNFKLTRVKAVENKGCTSAI